MKFVSVTLLAVTAFILSGCSTSQLQAAAASAGTAIAGTVASHVGGVNVSYDPATGTWSGGVVFKDVDGHYKYVAQDGTKVIVRAANPCVEPETRVVVRAINPCVEPAPKTVVRAVDNCGNTRALGEVVDLDRYVVETDRGLRAITGNILVTTRSSQRALTYSAREAREQEKESYKALKDIHKQEVRRLDRIALDHNPSMLGSLRRAFSGRGVCGQPVAATGTTTTWVETAPDTSTNTPPPFLPDPVNTTPPPSGVPPSGEMKAATNLELRVAAIETDLKGLKEDVRAIRDALRKP